MADEMRTQGSTWVEKQGRQYDLDIEDAQMGHLAQQNQMLQDCLIFAHDVDGYGMTVEKFFENEENYRYCLRQATDILDLDDYLVKKEHDDYKELQKKFEAYQKIHHSKQGPRSLKEIKAPSTLQQPPISNPRLMKTAQQAHNAKLVFQRLLQKWAIAISTIRTLISNDKLQIK